MCAWDDPGTRSGRALFEAVRGEVKEGIRMVLAWGHYSWDVSWNRIFGRMSRKGSCHAHIGKDLPRIVFGERMDIKRHVILGA